MADPLVPIFRAASVTSAGAFLDWSAVTKMGALYLRNAGPDECFLAWEALPTATIGDGRIRLKVDEAINLDAAKYESIGLRTSGADTAVVEAAGFPRPGSSGFGMA
jgi:hypothetical protein